MKIKITRDVILDIISDCVITPQDRVGNNIEYSVDDDKIEQWINKLSGDVEL